MVLHIQIWGRNTAPDEHHLSAEMLSMLLQLSGAKTELAPDTLEQVFKIAADACV